MKYMLMMSTPDRGPYEILSWAKQDLEAHGAFMHRLNGALRDNGELVTVVGLEAPDKAKLVRTNTAGALVTDGVFAESKEFLAGFWIVDVASPERAHELAGEISLAPGQGGAPLHMDVEVRALMFDSE
jgi:hypothetical protein